MTTLANPHELPRSTRYLLLLLFGLSGSAGLIYEVLWVRQFTLVLGASSYAITVTLAVFMAGLGLGAQLFGWFADRLDERKLARCYLLLELGIGLYALLLPELLTWTGGWFALYIKSAQPSAAAFNAARLLFAFTLLIIPTTLMGGTLPVVSRYLIRTQQRTALGVSSIYGINTLGAIAGVIAAGYWLLPGWGIRLTNYTAVMTNVVVGIAFYLIHLRIRQTAAGAPHAATPIAVATTRTAKPLTRLETATIVAFAVSGMAAMCYQVAWSRTLILVLGTTTYAFTTMLATFLLGLALGSLAYGWARRCGSAPGLFVTLQFIIAISAVATLYLFAKLPFVFLSLRSSLVTSWLSMQGLRFALSAMVMLIPTLALGMLFPTLSDILVHRTEMLGSRLGRASVFNSIGAVAGTVLAGMLLIPRFGMQNTIVLAAFCSFGAGALVCVFRTERTWKQRGIPLATAALILLVLVSLTSPWSPKVMSSGAYAYAMRYQTILARVAAAAETDPALAKLSAWQVWEQAMEQYELLYHKTGPVSTVSVMQRHDGVRFLTVDGKTDASTGMLHDMKTQVLLGQLPLLLHPAPQSVFVIGLGSGVTVGSVLTHPVKRVECAELSPAVIEAAQLFAHVNHDALVDPRLQLSCRDARNALLTSAHSYDVIINQPSNPWIEGQSALFSLEWYRLVHKHLNKNGVFAQWLPSYSMGKENLNIVIHTLRTVFPQVTLWKTGSEGDLLFLAGKHGQVQVDYEQFLDRVRLELIAADLVRIGHNPPRLLQDLFLMDAADLATYLYANRSGPIAQNTDNWLITQYAAPLARFQERSEQQVAQIKRLYTWQSSGLPAILGQYN